MLSLHAKNLVLTAPDVRQPRFEIRHESRAAAAVNQVTLADRLSRADLHAGEVLRYAADLSANLAERHRRGGGHGAIVPDAVILSGLSAQLRDSGAVGVSAAQDAAQFAALLRAMIGGVVAEERTTLASALGALIGQYLTAPAGADAQTFRKLVLVLKVLRLDYRVRKPAVEELPAAPPPPETEILPRADAAIAVLPAPGAPVSRGRRIRLLIRPAYSAAPPVRKPASRGFFRRFFSFPFLG